MNDPMTSARELLAAARGLYASHPAALAEIDELDGRLDQPLRVALVGGCEDRDTDEGEYYEHGMVG